ncbi:uncharacterized protein LOC127734453 isoform X2 [Mytilus californianus]|uniref:uncharacterized protein LOC127734453 isoform X2 n=1 Tax=Mytilus californianus TaxID=6549 RepID=UPI0022450549|nr:uncharacterized protein LOC127734453 isoform X2 [Mytilus californianus]
MEGRKLKDHIIQLYQSIKQVLSNEERQFLYKSLKEYKGCHDTDKLALQLCRLCTSSENVEIVRFVWTEIIHGQSAEFDQILKEYPVEQFQNQQIILKADNLRREKPFKSHTGRLFDEDSPTGNLHLIKIHKAEDNNIGFCIRGGLEHGLGVYVSGVDQGSAAEESTLQIGDKILEANNISLQRLPSSSAVKVLTGSNQLKLLVERTGMIPEWRLSRERTVWYDCQMKKVTNGEYEEYGATNYFRGIDVDIPERCVTSSNVTDEEDLGLNIRGGNEYRLGIYVSIVEEGSKADKTGIQIGDQIINVNGIPFDNISHAHAVETLNSDTHLIITLRDVGRFPVYKEIYAEYTWTGTSAPEGTGSIYGGEKLIERKLPDTWIEPDGHKKRKNLHLRVPVEVISTHDQHDGTDPLHQKIYLPEGDEISHGYQHGSSSNSESQSLIRSDSIDMKPVDTWIRGSGHTNPTFQPDDMGDNSSASSGTYGDYTVTMEDIIAKNNNRKLNIYESMHHKSEDNVDGGSMKNSGRKSVEKYIFDDDLESLTGTGSKQGSVRLDVNDDDIRSETISRHSLDIDDDESQNYLSSSTFSSFTQNSQQNKMISLTDWKQSVESIVPHMEADSTEMRESHSDDIDEKSDQSSSDDNEKEENFSISIVPGSAYKTNVKESRYRKKEDSRPKSSKFNFNINKTRYSSTESLQQKQGQMTMYGITSESTDDPNNQTTNNLNDETANNFMNSLHYRDFQNDNELSQGVNNINIIDSSTRKQKRSHGTSPVENLDQGELYETRSQDDINSQTTLVLHDFDRHIQNLEDRKKDLGMFEMSNLTAEESESKEPSTKERRGSLFKIARMKSKDMGAKRSSWKIIKNKIRSGLFKKTAHGDNEKRADFVWSKYNPNTYDEDGMGQLEKSARELFDPDEVVAIIKYIKNYHDDHDVDSLVEYLVVHIDIPEKILLLKDVRQVIYKFDMYHFDELVKQIEIENYEKLSSNVHQKLNREKRGKPKKHILHPETDEFGHFYIKPTKQNESREQEIQSNAEDDKYIEKYGRDIIVSHVSKQKDMLGLCVSGGVECKRQPQIKVEEVLEDGAAADEPRIQPGMIVLAIDDTDLREATHTDAILTLKKSFKDKKKSTMTIILTDSVMC